MVIVPHDIKDSKDQVKCIKHVESDQEVVEANLLLKINDLELSKSSCRASSDLVTFLKRTKIESVLPMKPKPANMNIKAPGNKC